MITGEWKYTKFHAPKVNVQFKYRGEERIWNGFVDDGIFYTYIENGQKQNRATDEERSKDVIAWRYVKE